MNLSQHEEKWQKVLEDLKLTKSAKLAESISLGNLDKRCLVKVRKYLVSMVISEEQAKLAILSEEQRVALGVDMTRPTTFYYFPKSKQFVIRVTENTEDERGFTARSTRAQIKQWMPYMPAGVVDKMLVQAPNIKAARQISTNHMATSNYCSQLIKKKQTRTA